MFCCFFSYPKVTHKENNASLLFIRRRLTSNSSRFQQYHPTSFSGRQWSNHGLPWDPRLSSKDLEARSKRRLMAWNQEKRIVSDCAVSTVDQRGNPDRNLSLTPSKSVARRSNRVDVPVRYNNTIDAHQIELSYRVYFCTIIWSLAV